MAGLAQQVDQRQLEVAGGGEQAVAQRVAGEAAGIKPGERGIASIWYKDVLIYLSSLINAKIERGEEVSRTVRIAAYDMLRVTRRHTGKNGYQEICAV